jgi:hypothetical protein
MNFNKPEKNMSYDISKILSFDDDFFNSFQILADKFVPILATSKYKNTSLTLLGLLGSATSIKLSIYDLAEESETHLYTIQLLNRSLIEHYLKFYYILIRFLKEKDDEIGIEYRKFSRINEVLNYINATNATVSIVDKPMDKLILEELKKKYPELDISKKQLNNITMKWKHRAIVKYLIENADFVDNSYFLNFIPKYAKLSSFVHGSIFAEEFYHEAYEKGILDKLLYESVASSCIKTTHMKVSLMLAVLQIDESFQDGMVLLTEKYNNLYKLVKT